MSQLAVNPHPGIVLKQALDQHQLDENAVLGTGHFNLTVLRRVLRGEMAMSADMAVAIERKLPQLNLSAQKLLYQQADYALRYARNENKV